MDHLIHAGGSDAEQRAALGEIIRAQPVLMRILKGMRRLDLPDPLLVSGAIYNCVWNVLTERAPLHGVKDVDVAYFDDTDLSYDAEDRVIRAAAEEFGDIPLPIEVRNQARVHLWFPDRFGSPYPKLNCSADMLTRFASKTHAVGMRLAGEGDALEMFAPFGLDDMFSFRLTPNYALDNRETHTAKAERIKMLWPEVTVVPW
ncbi:hypothetical protein GCM10007989_23680 [Devosia pacifica]|uniref:Nucleotidyltransferase family protein n=1 Tax=Devosia pacifica TaxID=1335967 RepID=A0A918S919_9HYPH|nr:nucleotidyltransferase family protein [Devosia pacifica]GHA27115.1 hypothetical protein GCM10007989_23680 [Devosia pacifica]